ncbi:MAG: heme exporter protein CcmD [Caulobacteraceae bacterium]
MSLPVPNLELGKYAVYVWPAYGLSALTIVAMLVQSLVRARRWRLAAERAPSRRDQVSKTPQTP